MNLDLWIVIGYASLVLVGGVIARVKGDYFTRGMGISFLAGIFGLLALTLSRRSKARKGDEQDDHGWPTTSYMAVLLQMFLVFIILIKYWFS
jgi:hypothetical protein